MSCLRSTDTDHVGAQFLPDGSDSYSPLFVSSGSQPADALTTGSSAPVNAPGAAPTKTPPWIWIVALLLFLFAKNPPKL